MVVERGKINKVVEEGMLEVESKNSIWEEWSEKIVKVDSKVCGKVCRKKFGYEMNRLQKKKDCCEKRGKRTEVIF